MLTTILQICTVAPIDIIYCASRSYGNTEIKHGGMLRLMYYGSIATIGEYSGIQEHDTAVLGVCRREGGTIAKIKLGPPL